MDIISVYCFLLKPMRVFVVVAGEGVIEKENQKHLVN